MTTRGSSTHNHHWSESNVVKNVEDIFKHGIQRKILMYGCGFEVGLGDIESFRDKRLQTGHGIEATITTRHADKFLDVEMGLIVHIIGSQRKYYMDEPKDGSQPDVKTAMPVDLKLLGKIMITNLCSDHPHQFDVQFALDQTPGRRYVQLASIMGSQMCLNEVKHLVLGCWAVLRKELNVPNSLVNAEIDQVEKHAADVRKIGGWLTANMHTKVKRHFEMTWKKAGYQIGAHALRFVPIGLIFGVGTPFIFAAAITVPQLGFTLFQPKDKKTFCAPC